MALWRSGVRSPSAPPFFLSPRRAFRERSERDARRGGGTGRRAGLKNPWPKGRESSILSLGSFSGTPTGSCTPMSRPALTMLTLLALLIGAAGVQASSSRITPPRSTPYDACVQEKLAACRGAECESPGEICGRMVECRHGSEASAITTGALRSACERHLETPCASSQDCGSFPCWEGHCYVRFCNADDQCRAGLCGMHATPVPGFCTTIDVK
jgi:hypothetical protein